MLIENQKRYQKLESEYMSKIQKADENIKKVMEMVGASNHRQLPKDLFTEVATLKSLIYPLKRELREIRFKMREDITNLFFQLKVMNVALGPRIVFLIFFFATAYRRSSQSKKLKTPQYRMD